MKKTSLTLFISALVILSTSVYAQKNDIATAELAFGKILKTNPVLDETTEEIVDVDQRIFDLLGGPPTKDNNNIWITTSADELSASTSPIAVFPNPAKGEMVTIKNENHPITQIEIIDLNGKTISIPFMSGAQNTVDHAVKITTAELPEGNYLIKTTTENGEHTTPFIRLEN